MKRFISIITVVLLVISAALAGCTSKPVINNPKASASDGYYTPGQAYKGGQPFSQKGGVNVKEMAVAKQGDTTTIELKFLYGSKGSGVSEARLNHVPEYEVMSLPLPERLAVKVKDVEYADYLGNLPAFDGMVKGVMEEVREDSYTVYFALGAAADYKVEETAESLKITLKAANAQKAQGYFATLDKYSDYVNTDSPEAYAGFTPTLCSDGTSYILISQMFGSQADAEKFRDEAQSKLENVVISVVQLASGELPEVTEGDIGAMKVIKKDNASYALPLLVNNGTYLATSPDGKILFCRNTDPGADTTVTEDDTGDTGDAEEGGEADGSPSIQKLWLSGKPGDEQPFAGDYDFSGISKAQFSPDGKYVAILDKDGDNNVLNVYDIAANNLLNMGEEGLGTVTDDFAWNSEKDVLYSISGNIDDEGNPQKQLMVTDFTKTDYKPVPLEGDQVISSGKLGYAGGKLYLLDYGDESQTIYTYDPVTDTRKKLIDGLDFTLSTDGKYMVYLTESKLTDAEADSPDEYFDMTLLNLATSEKKTIAEKAILPPPPYGGFTSDNSRFYYMNQAEGVEGADATFSTPLYYYDLASGETKLDCITTSVSVGIPPSSGKVYLNNTYAGNGDNRLYASYVYDYTKNYAAK